MTGKRAKGRAFILIIAAFAIGYTGVWLLQQPDYYEATARVEIKTSLTNAFDFTSLEKLQTLPTQTVTNVLVESLCAAAMWDDKYSTGMISADEALSLLKNDIRFAFVTNNTLVFADITVTRADPIAAAKIADAVASCYCDEGFWTRTNIAEIVRDQEQVASQKFTTAKAEYDQWTNPPAVTDASTSDEIQNYSSYVNAKLKYEKAREEMNGYHLFHSGLGVGTPASISSKAQPPEFPVGPNRIPGKFLFGFGLFLCIAGGLSIWRTLFANPMA